MDTQPRTAAESVPTHLIGSRPALSAQPRFQRPEARSGPQRTPVAVPPVLFTGRIDHSTGELEVARRVERGTSRFVDRLEAQVTEAQEQTEVVRQQKSRLLIALGAELRESERLREALVDARSQLARIAAKPEPEPVPRGFWARLTGTSRARSER